MFVRLRLPLVGLELRDVESLGTRDLARFDMVNYEVEYSNAGGGIQVALMLNTLCADDLLHGGTRLVSTVDQDPAETGRVVRLRYSRNGDAMEMCVWTGNMTISGYLELAHYSD